MSVFNVVAGRDIAAFYDAFSEQLLRDFVNGNRRVELAVQRVLGAITRTTERILDIGCGIGSTAAEYVQHAPWIKVLGIDISPVNIGIAQRLFTDQRLTFGVSDMRTSPDARPFDLIAMLDVYEHVPRNEWPEFNRAIAESLSDTGVVVLTTPSALHQEYLHKHKPDALQIIDETVTLSDVIGLANDIGATITTYDWVDVWRTNQYVHVVMERRPQLESLRQPRRSDGLSPQGFYNSIKSAAARRSKKRHIADRKRLVKDRLGVVV